MRSTTRLSACAALFALALSMLPGCKPSNDAPGGATSTGEVKRFVFLTNGPDPYWDALLSGLEEGAKIHDLAGAGMSVSRDVNNASAEGQIEKLRQYATQDDIVGVAISVIQADNQSIADEMRNLQKKGVKVITVDGEVNRDEFRDARSYYIGTDNFEGGKALGKAARAILEAKGKTSGGYVQFAGFTDNDNARSRMDGVKAAIGEQFKEVDRMADDMDHQRARENVRNAMTNHNDLAALIGIWAYNAPAIADVVTETKARDKYVVATFDAQAQAIAEMEKGNIDAMVGENPFEMGIQTVRLLKAMVQNDEAVTKKMFPNAGQPDGDIYTTGLRVVVPNTESAVKADMFDSKIVEHMSLPDFQAWLAKYGLAGS